MTTTTADVEFGSLLRERRNERRYSQLQLAAAAGVSQRHLSFLETGRSRPSREMVIHLATILDLPLRDHNRMLLAAGYAPVYPETALEEPALDRVRSALEFILDAHEPFPAIVVDRRWDVVMSNDAASRLTATIIDPATAPVGAGVNLARLTFHPDGLRRVTANWEEVAGALLERLTREVAARPGDAVLRALADEMETYPGVEALASAARSPSGDDLLLPIHYRTDSIDVRLVSTIATLGSPYDVTLEELHLESFYPADADSEAVLRAMARVTAP